MSDSGSGGKIAIIVALIGLIGTLGAVFLDHYLDDKKQEPGNAHKIVEVEKKTEPKEPLQEKEPDEASIKNSKEEATESAKNVLSKFIFYWTNKDLDKMASLLHRDFFYQDQDVYRQNRANYLKEKRNLFQKHKWIEIETSNVEVSFPDKKFLEGVITYDQHYNTPTYESWGPNKLFFKKVRNEYKITKELFLRDRFKRK